MLLHIVDDEKFIDAAIELFETVSFEKNIYLVNATSPNNLKHIKYSANNIFVFPYGSHEYNEVLNKKYQSIIFHNIYGYKLEIINKLDEKVNIHWLSWGFDLYINPDLKKNLFLPLTRQLYFASMPKKDMMAIKFANNYPQIWNLLNHLIYREPSTYYRYKNALKKVKSASTVVENEFYLIQKYFGKHIKYIPFKYGSLEQLGKGVLNDICNDDSILIGNSATFTGNHLDAFQVIKNLSYNKINVPLSYGSLEYGKKVAETGKELFGKKMNPIFNFLPLDEYNNILKSSGIVIMNHIRQQAMGNIIVSLWLGAKIYLQPQNPLYQFLKNKNFKIYNINNFQNKEIESYEELAISNRKKLNEYYSHDKTVITTKCLVQYLTKK